MIVLDVAGEEFDETSDTGIDAAEVAESHRQKPSEEETPKILSLTPMSNSC